MSSVSTPRCALWDAVGPNRSRAAAATPRRYFRRWQVGSPPIVVGQQVRTTPLAAEAVSETGFVDPRAKLAGDGVPGVPTRTDSAHTSELPGAGRSRAGSLHSMDLREHRRKPSSDRSRGVFGISVISELTGVGPQTLRLYEQRGLITPSRTSGGRRRYSHADLEVLTRITELVDAGVNVSGIKLILALEQTNLRLQEEHVQLRSRAEVERRS